MCLQEEQAVRTDAGCNWCHWVEYLLLCFIKFKRLCWWSNVINSSNGNVENDKRQQRPQLCTATLATTTTTTPATATTTTIAITATNTAVVYNNNSNTQRHYCNYNSMATATATTTTTTTAAIAITRRPTAKTSSNNSNNSNYNYDDNYVQPQPTTTTIATTTNDMASATSQPPLQQHPCTPRGDLHLPGRADISCCRVGVVYPARSSACFLCWICTIYTDPAQHLITAG